MTNPSEFLTEGSLACHRIILGTDLGYYIIVQNVSKQEAPSCKKGVFWVFFYVECWSVFQENPSHKNEERYHITICITVVDVESEWISEFVIQFLCGFLQIFIFMDYWWTIITIIIIFGEEILSLTHILKFHINIEYIVYRIVYFLKSNFDGCFFLLWMECV